MTVKIAWPADVPQKRIDEYIDSPSVPKLDNDKLVELGHVVGGAACPGCNGYTGFDARHNGTSQACRCGGRVHLTHTSEAIINERTYTLVNFFCDKCGEDCGRSLGAR